MNGLWIVGKFCVFFWRSNEKWRTSGQHLVHIGDERTIKVARKFEKIRLCPLGLKLSVLENSPVTFDRTNQLNKRNEVKKIGKFDSRLRPWRQFGIFIYQLLFIRWRFFFFFFSIRQQKNVLTAAAQNAGHALHARLRPKRINLR